MSLATTTFGVNHIVAGVAINLIAPGTARFMASELFVDVQGGSITTSPGNKGSIGDFTVPFVSGGDLFGWTTPDVIGWFEDKGWFLLADIAGPAQGTHDGGLAGTSCSRSACSSGSAYLLWHTPLGLRLRAAGERPAAADSLGVNVHRMRHIGIAMSGGARRSWVAPCSCCSPTATRRTRSPVAASSGWRR